MKRLLIQPVLLAVLALVMTSPQAMASPFAKPDEPSGVVILNTPRQAQQIYPAQLVRIDGQEVPTRDGGLWLKPGTHQLRLVAGEVDASMAGGLKARQRLLSAAPAKGKELTLHVEAGKKYYVGYDVSDRDPKNWKPVVWQVK